INKYPKLYMMLGTKFGQDGKFNFKLPDLREKAPAGLVYCIAIEGELPRLQDEDGQAGIPFIESAKEEETLTDGELEMVAGGITNIERDQLKEK
ncbi:MAG TPA: phage tail protein, partial [Negativicutes bacterium]|nr:phage tail protein [Negativicutes bacterium]